MAFELPPLPYEMDALAPHISKETLEYHYGKHHRTYVDNLNKLVAGTEMENASLEEVISKAEVGTGLFNNAAQTWNHTFYWHSMAPGGGGAPTGEVADRIGRSFGSYEEFRSKLTEAAVTLFGSGWAWVVDDGDRLEIMQTSNADLPLKHSAKALLTIDVWEHAYYIDYRNLRAKYVEVFLDHLVNWEHANANLT
ncbi:MAG: superoxide dismutase [Fe] [Acidimicrobiales bacterium]|nr:MAG: superoxide dismutase [Fe] [Acidimicrobiales bacterium]